MDPNESSCECDLARLIYNSLGKLGLNIKLKQRVVILVNRFSQ